MNELTFSNRDQVADLHAATVWRVEDEWSLWCWGEVRFILSVIVVTNCDSGEESTRTGVLCPEVVEANFKSWNLELRSQYLEHRRGCL